MCILYILHVSYMYIYLLYIHTYIIYIYIILYIEKFEKGNFVFKHDPFLISFQLFESYNATIMFLFI